MPNSKNIRKLAIVLGDQLDIHAPLFEALEPEKDRIWMAEVDEESTHIWSSKQRIAIFLSAMRHFRTTLRDQGYTVDYRYLDDKENQGSLNAELSRYLCHHEVDEIYMTHPGDYRVKESISRVCEEQKVQLTILEDTHFMCSPDDFQKHADGRKQLRMEFFYREMRRNHRVLMEGDQPVGGKWNYDANNRESFGKDGPASLFRREGSQPDSITQEVIDLVNTHFADHPGSLDEFRWPVTREEALVALDQFIDCHLSEFGRYQDAMWMGEAFLNHSLLSSSLNLKLLNPREVIHAAENSYQTQGAPLESVEGFIRQILGWREYVRGIYWLYMPEYLERNALNAEHPLPQFFWTGETDMQCLSETITQTLRYGYAHHIQRLMVTGLFTLLAGVDPKEVHAWYLSVYVDAVEWVELPNVLGMSQYADGGIMASKPYVATGKYIQRMSNYCNHCKYNPANRTGEDACPFTTLYWNFLMKHETTLSSNQRMGMQLRNLRRISDSEKADIIKQSEVISSKIGLDK